MSFLTNLARKILHKEIAELEEKAKRFEDRGIELRAELEEVENRNSDLLKAIGKVDSEKMQVQKKLDEIQKENEILRQYYDLDKEPSDEIKTKIHIDLEVNRLKEENLKLTALVKPPVLAPQPYHIYMPPFRIF